jgi:hypothetical protein
MAHKDDETPRPSSFYEYIDAVGAIAAISFIALITAAVAYRHRR